MKGSKIVGILIILIIICSIGVVSYYSISKSISPKPQGSEVVLTPNDINSSGNETTGNDTIETVNLTINKRSGDIKIMFADTDTICNVTSKSKNSTPTITSSKENSTVKVNINSENSDNKIVLSKRYKYNITGSTLAGGLDLNLSKDAKVDNCNYNLTTGGINIGLNNGTLNNFTSHIASGGMNIVGMPSGVTTINSTIEVGGINVQLSEPVAHILSNVKLGGLNPGDYQKISDNNYKGKSFDVSSNKLVVYGNVEVGGINAQTLK